ncbi:hypothetical protein E4U33_001087 [Claviceps sp. LM78 group G4]|nr:hypothetical protein E4U33_001086 [Claviceps sp. LM78 group G4]KAG6077774.1 hypothetical protein E4U33_001087 [Claviceps sp. LM78 group G4]
MDVWRILNFPDGLPGNLPAGHPTNATPDCEEQNSSTAASQSSSTHSAERSDHEVTVALSFDLVSGLHETQLKRNDNAKSSAKSRRKYKDMMRELEEVKKELQRRDEKLRDTIKSKDAEIRDTIKSKDAEIRDTIKSKDAENERLRQQLEKQAQR